MAKLFQTTVTVLEAARITKSSLARLYNAVYFNTIPSRRVAGHWEMDAPSVRAYAKAVALQRRILERKYARSR